MVLPHREQVAGAPTVTVTDWSGVVPPDPVHWKVNVVLVVRALVRPLPFKLLPVGGVRFDQLPDTAVQLVALVDDQVRVARPLYATGFGEAVREVVGAGQLLVSHTLVPLTQTELFQQRSVLQVLAAQSLQALVPCTVVIPLWQVAVVQVLAAQPLSEQTALEQSLLAIQDNDLL